MVEQLPMFLIDFGNADVDFPGLVGVEKGKGSMNSHGVLKFHAHQVNYDYLI